jgi:hypothetical protein
MLDVAPNKRTRIAVIQYRWDVQSYTRDLIKYLANQGYRITFFVDKTSLRCGLINADTLRRPNVEVIELSERRSPKTQLWRRIWARVEREVLARLHSPLWLIDCSDLNKVTQWVTAHKGETLSIIGIEKAGLIFSGIVARKSGIPYIYYSLELFFKDRSKYWYFQHQLGLESRYHRRACATIVQDKLRGDALFFHNRVKRQSQIYIPIGVPSLQKLPSTHYWHRKFSLPVTSKVFLYFGHLSCSLRSLDKLVDAWVGCPQDYVLVLHGNGESTEIKTFCEQRRLPNVFVSTELVREEQLRELISSADVGMCVYKNTNANDRLTAFSSQKIALYLREAVPIISADNESYQTLYQEFKCGCAISNYNEVGVAARNILADYTSFKNEARRAFDTVYANEASFPKLQSFLNRLA